MTIPRLSPRSRAGAVAGVLLICGTSSLAAQTATAGSQAPAAPAAIAGIDSTVAAAVAAWRVPGISISVVQDGRVLLAKGYGVRDPRSGAPFTADTRVPIASLAKAFTATGVGILVDEGRLAFDAPVRRYLPAFAMSDPIATAEVTLRDLLSHRSGLRGYDDFLYFRNPSMPPETLLARIAHLPLQSRAGRRYEYSNAAYVVVGQAIEAVSGRPYERFMEERVFRPLGMRRTSFGIAAAASDPDHAVGQLWWRGQPTYELYDYGRIINPHGGISSTARDMAAWMLLNLSAGTHGDTRIVLPSTLRDVHRTQIAATLMQGPHIVPMGYGMGWNTQVYRGQPLLFHNGVVQGVRAATALLPDSRIGVTVLSNENTNLPDLLALEVIDRLLGASPVERLAPALASRQRVLLAREEARAAGAASPATTERPTQPSHPLSAYVGRYLHPAFGTIDIVGDGEQLAATWNGHRARLAHRHFDVFDGVATDPVGVLANSFQFLSSVDGRITHLLFGQWRADPFQKQPDARLSDPAYLKSVAGVYELGGVRLTITAQGTRLVYQRDQLEPVTLVPGLDGEFSHPGAANLLMSFATGADGRVTLVRRDDSVVSRYERIQQP